VFTKADGELKGKSNLEERARNARYDFLSETARKRKAKFVLTAHTQNDQAETFLLNLIRGSGTAGLGGMQAIRELRNEGLDRKGKPTATVKLVRPLLNWAKRENTEQFCASSKTEIRTDSMNSDRSFQRVRVRKEIIPFLAELNPKIVETLARTAELLRIDGYPPEPNVPKGEITIAEARKLEKKELYSLLRNWLREKRGNTRSLQLKHIEAIERLVSSPKSGRVAELPGGDSVLKSGGRLVFREKKLEN